jgi:hypothetical protein
MNSIERLRQFIENQKVSERKFFLKSGLPVGAFNKIKSIGSENLKKISIAFPEINMDWVITGRGEMILKNEEKSSPDQEQLIASLQQNLADKEKVIALLESQVTAVKKIRHIQ